MRSPFLGEICLTSSAWGVRDHKREQRGVKTADRRAKKNPPWALSGGGAVQPLVLKLEAQIRRGGVLGIFGSQF